MAREAPNILATSVAGCPAPQLTGFRGVGGNHRLLVTAGYLAKIVAPVGPFLDMTDISVLQSAAPSTPVAVGPRTATLEPLRRDDKHVSAVLTLDLPKKCA